MEKHVPFLGSLITSIFSPIPFIILYETGEILCTKEERYDAEAFLRFHEHVLSHYRSGKVVMILDNARIHHAKLIQPFLKKNQQRLEWVFLPPYTQLNLVEGLWKWLKESVINHVFFGNVQKIMLAVRAFIREVSQSPDDVINRLCIKL
jgi:transposase